MYFRVKWEDPIPLNNCGKAILLIKRKIKQERQECMDGIYVIWSVDDSTIVYVGSGDIYQRLYDHIDRSDDPVVKRQDNYPHLMASYAFIEMKKIYEGAENYLAYMYQPQLGENFPNVMPREVNLIPDEFFNIEPRICGILSTDFADNWQEYVDNFRQWAIDEQHRNPDDLKEPQQCIVTNLCLENLQAETKGEEFYFKDFLGALLSTESEEAFNRLFQDIVNNYPRFPKWSPRWTITTGQERCRSMLSDLIQYSTQRLSSTVTRLRDYIPNLLLHQDLNPYILCEIKAFNSEYFNSILEDFAKIRIMADLMLGTNYYVFLLTGIDIETFKSIMKEKVPESEWNRYYPEMVCIFLHDDRQSLDYARLGYIKAEIDRTRTL